MIGRMTGHAPQLLVPFNGSGGAEDTEQRKSCVQDRGIRRALMLDVLFLGIVVVFFGLTFGYAAFCDRL